MRDLLCKLGVASLLATSLIPNIPAQAQTQVAQNAVNCNIVETFGNALIPTLLPQINETAAGQSHRINRRKTLVINKVDDLSFQECELVVDVDATLKRKIRRNAHGNIRLKANISSFNLPRREVCYTDLRVTDVDFSRTLRIGESVYRRAANSVLPDSGCFSQ